MTAVHPEATFRLLNARNAPGSDKQR